MYKVGCVKRFVCLLSQGIGFSITSHADPQAMANIRFGVKLVILGLSFSWILQCRLGAFRGWHGDAEAIRRLLDAWL